MLSETRKFLLYFSVLYKSLWIAAVCHAAQLLRFARFCTAAPGAALSAGITGDLFSQMTESVLVSVILLAAGGCAAAAVLRST